MKDGPMVLMVGHCIPDSFSLSRLVGRAAPGARTKRINSTGALRKSLDLAALLLVNRALDGRFTDSDGIGLIARLRAEGVTTPMILVSNFDDAQAAAVEVGATPGFGKRDAGSSAAAERVARALAGRCATKIGPG